MFERPDNGERALLVFVSLAQAGTPEQLSEFRELATSAGLEVAECLSMQRDKPDPRSFVGAGKLEEIAWLVKQHEIEVVLFGQRLSPSQERNLEREFKCRVLDRNALILDIFAQRARSFEGKLQVELAQLSHLSTRLVRGWTHLERQKGGIGLRGPGETQLETDRRLLADRVKTIRRRLDKVRRQRDQGRAMRNKTGVPSVALVGYTNAGKSTLFNRLTSDSVYAADQLFATLDPTLRRLSLDGGRHVVLADTVGFIRELPHELVDAFRSTLVETREADLLLHVVDASDPEREEKMQDVDRVLAEIGAAEVPQLQVFNKVDQLDRTAAAARTDRNANGDIERVWLSAHSGQGLEALREAIVESVGQQRLRGHLRVAPHDGRLRALCYESQAVLDEVCESDGTMVLHIDIDLSVWQSWCTQPEFGARLEEMFAAETDLLAAGGQAQ